MRHAYTRGAVLKLSQKAEEAIKQGYVKVRVTRGGIAQQITFKVRRADLGGTVYTELFTDRIIPLSDLSRIAEEIGLPVEAPNGRAFPKGTGASDFSCV